MKKLLTASKKSFKSLFLTEISDPAMKICSMISYLTGNSMFIISFFILDKRTINVSYISISSIIILLTFSYLIAYTYMLRVVLMD